MVKFGLVDVFFLVGIVKWGVVSFVLGVLLRIELNMLNMLEEVEKVVGDLA